MRWTDVQSRGSKDIRQTGRQMKVHSIECPQRFREIIKGAAINILIYYTYTDGSLALLGKNIDIPSVLFPSPVSPIITTGIA